MNKKILIASIFATLMLLVPTTSVVGVSDVEEDCNCKNDYINNPKDDRPICILIDNIYSYFVNLSVYFYNKAESYPDGSELNRFYELLHSYMVKKCFGIYMIGGFLGYYEEGGI
jgi:hypothetical protein